MNMKQRMSAVSALQLLCFPHCRSECEGVDVALRVSFTELYNDDVRDLMDTENPDKPITIRDDVHGNVVIAGLKEVPVSDIDDMQARCRLSRYCAFEVVSGLFKVCRGHTLSALAHS